MGTETKAAVRWMMLSLACCAPASLAFAPSHPMTAMSKMLDNVDTSGRGSIQRLECFSGNSSTHLCASVNDEEAIGDGGVSVATAEAVEQRYPGAEIVTLKLEDHRPLGCTVEESLDEEADRSIVFVSKLVENGNAKKGGVEVGDVLVGVTGMFSDCTLVLESGLDKIKSFVASVPKEETLVLQVARGTGVMERHEKAIVDLCQVTGASDKEVENCVVDYLSSSYKDAGALEPDDGECLLDEDGDTDCMIDSMMDMWADELPLPPTTSGITDENNGDTTAKKAKPWSSRSSPSGTYVRDPVTGEMRNIDA